MERLMGAFLYARARLQEPSSLSALSSVCVIIGIHFDVIAFNDWITTLGLIFGMLGFFVKEGQPVTRV